MNDSLVLRLTEALTKAKSQGQHRVKLSPARAGLTVAVDVVFVAQGGCITISGVFLSGTTANLTLGLRDSGIETIKRGIVREIGEC